MIVLRSTVGSDELSSCCIASEEKDIERVSHIDELLLRYLLGLPEVFGGRRRNLESIALGFLDVLSNGNHPFSAALFARCSEEKVPIISFNDYFELISISRRYLEHQRLLTVRPPPSRGSQSRGRS